MRWPPQMVWAIRRSLLVLSRLQVNNKNIDRALENDNVNMTNKMECNEKA